MVVALTVGVTGQIAAATLTAMHMVTAARTYHTYKTALVRWLCLYISRTSQDNFLMYIAASKCNNGDIHLVGGMTNSTGRLELCANGIWGRVCNALQFWGPDNAKVVCRQLGFSEIGNKLMGSSEI